MKKLESGQVLGLSLLCLGVAGAASAGTGGTEFDGLYNLVEGWMQGTLGALAGIVGVGVGLFAGVLRGNMVAAVTGIGTGVAMYYSPEIIGGIVTATLPTLPDATAALAVIPLV